MNTMDALHTRVDVREYTDEPVDDEIKGDILEAARVASSGRNSQHWRFILIDEPDHVDSLGELSPTGSWVSKADFAVAVVTDPSYDFHKIDAGKAITNMQLAAWEHGIVSCMFTTNAQAVVEFLDIPDDRSLTAIVGFGHPVHEIQGKKNRKPLSEITYGETFGSNLTSIE